MNRTRHSGPFFGFTLFLALVAVSVFYKPAIAAPPPNADASQRPVTFTKDVAPIFQEKCQSCHRDGAMAPMPLTTYQEARPWARDIRQRVLTRSMPPWFLDKTVGIQHFSNDISLTDAQIATVVKWVDEGAPQGDPKDMPAPKTFADNESGWKLESIIGRQPDMVIKGPDYTVKTGDQDQWYRPVTDVGLTEPRWVMAVEMRPSSKDARRVFHHILASLNQDETNAPSAQIKVLDDSHLGSGTNAGMGGMLMEWAINKNFDIYRDGTGKLLMPGAKIEWEYHTHPIDRDISGHAELAVYFYPKGVTPKYRTYLTGFQASSREVLDIAPNAVHETQGFTVLKAAARLENFQPHMHLRGKAMSMEAILPDGTAETLSFVDHFNFNWMTNYIYADDAAPVLPKGTVIHITAWHDNTAANPNNPDPTQWIGWGQRTVDEMAFAWVNVTYISDSDYKDWVAKHQKKADGGKQAGAVVGEP